MPKSKKITDRWNLTDLYARPTDPQIDKDFAQLEKMTRDFAGFKGRLDARLGETIRAQAEISSLSNKIFGYLHLRQSLNVNDETVRSRRNDLDRRWAALAGEKMTFFDLELARLPEETVNALIAQDETCRRHAPFIADVRRWRPHQLSEPVETALAKRGPFGSSAWADFYDVVETDLRFAFRGRRRTLEQMLEIISNHKQAAVRARAMKTINDGFRGSFAKYSAQALSIIAGLSAVERQDRNYAQPMSARNLDNRLPDEAVEALHRAVLETAAPLARRFYRLKAKLLGLKRLRWSDRNARLPSESEKPVPYAAGFEIVLAAYRSFSPKLAEIISDLAAAGRIDAPVGPNKESGAYNMTLSLPERRAASFVFLNYLGSPRNVMTLAHELGHAVHGTLAAEAQGPLMWAAPTAYAETASVFGEMTVFEHLRSGLAKPADRKRRLALLMGKIDDFMNTVVRQISFSNFERHLHGAGRRLSAEELSAAWLQETAELYGRDGDVFEYRDMDQMWSYVSHFHRPFYVYGYAVGELLTQGLYARRGAFGDRFSAMYLDLLRAGGTKDAVGLLKPFGLDPTVPTFWSDGIKNSVGRLIDEAEDLAS